MNKVVLMGLLFGVAATGLNAQDNDGIFSYKIGHFEIYILVESERDGNADILVGADKSLLDSLLPAGGFKHTANAILVKAPAQNFLIDTGTGSGGIIIEKIKKLGVEPSSVDAVLLTHLHGDHFGSLQSGGEAVFPKAKVYLSAKEHEYFTKTNVNRAAAAALDPYGSHVVTFDPAALDAAPHEILPGIHPIAAYGHTPGHTLYLLESGGEKLLVAGDLLHVALVQFAHPEISATYDMDQKEAAAVRRQVLEYAAANNITLAGMHIVYPGTGKVTKDGDGFKFTPSSPQ
ncbi:MAG: MBL fold metallo-hydrolase [Treponema sp.]|jgi:glyoxylase-like metal-dependent hydrolase (beta-lactamase superfamily II)|nr:MBL fold metallo-hydrolase [Treponema sp.]